MRQSDDDAMLDALRDVEEGLTEWELRFVESLLLQRRMQPGRSLTGRQRAKCIAILERLGECES